MPVLHTAGRRHSLRGAVNVDVTQLTVALHSCHLWLSPTLSGGLRNGDYGPDIKNDEVLRPVLTVYNFFAVNSLVPDQFVSRSRIERTQTDTRIRAWIAADHPALPIKRST